MVAKVRFYCYTTHLITLMFLGGFHGIAVWFARYSGCLLECCYVVAKGLLGGSHGIAM